MSYCLEEPIVNNSPQCQYFVVRKKRLCRMTVRPGKHYCGEHEPHPRIDTGQNDTRIPCPNDPKHTCYASKLQKHLAICNARTGEQPAYIVPLVNAPAAADADAPARRALSQVPRETLNRVIDKVNNLYDEYVKDCISEMEDRPIHPVVCSEYSEPSRTESSRRHLRQVSSLLWLGEDAGLVRERTCYVELGAGKGHLSYHAWRAWCAPDAASRVLLVDRASLRHKRDNKLRGLADETAPTTNQKSPAAGGCTRLRADLAHLALHEVPDVRDCDSVVGFAKHLCGVATDYALHCLTAEGVRGKVRGLVIATCCHHRIDTQHYFGLDNLKELGVTDEELDVMLGMVSWGTCGDGRPRQRRPDAPPADSQGLASRSAIGRRTAALLEACRARALRARGLRARLVRYVRAAASPENLALLATRDE